jgi:hypothetical protein
MEMVSGCAAMAKTTRRLGPDSCRTKNKTGIFEGVAALCNPLINILLPRHEAYRPGIPLCMHAPAVERKRWPMKQKQSVSTVFQRHGVVA